MLGASVSTLLSVHKTVGDAVGEGEGSGGGRRGGWLNDGLPTSWTFFICIHIIFSSVSR